MSQMSPRILRDVNDVDVMFPAAARLESSPRLQRVLKLLARGHEYSTLDIVYHAKVCAVNSIIGELRQQGFDIRCERRADIWYYRLAAPALESVA